MNYDNLQLILTLLASLIALVYWKKASLGLEKHLKKVAVGFVFVSLYELFTYLRIFNDSKIVELVKFSSAFGLMSLISYMSLFIALLILSSWTWYYLLKRLQTQIFILTMSGLVLLTLVITLSFSTLLIKSLETESLGKMTSNAKVIKTMIDDKRGRLLVEAKLFTQKQELLAAYEANDRKKMYDIGRKEMDLLGISNLVITDSNGSLVVKAENYEERGVSWSSDKYVIKALNKEDVSGVAVVSGVLAPQVYIKIAVPLSTGVVVFGQALDDVFVDYTKKSTDLNISLYGDKILSATSLDIGDHKTRLNGIKETNQEVLNKVWQAGEVFASNTKIADQEYLSAYVPLYDYDNTIVAVLQASQPQVVTLQVVAAAIQMTFALVILVMIVMSIPLNLISQKLVADWK